LGKWEERRERGRLKARASVSDGFLVAHGDKSGTKKWG